jgi:hypothetical protein
VLDRAGQDLPGAVGESEAAEVGVQGSGDATLVLEAGGDRSQPAPELGREPDGEKGVVYDV